jgi:hypothetical protein
MEDAERCDINLEEAMINLEMGKIDIEKVQKISLVGTQVR